MKKFLLIAILIYFIPLLSSAQNANDISLDIFPEFPGPNQNVNLSVKSFLFDLNKLKITWLVDDKEKLSGIGKKEFSTKTGPAGSKTKVKVVIQIDKTNQIEKEEILSPSEVAILWEAIDSFRPPFYKGKPLPSLGTTIKVTALPQLGKNISVSDLNNFVFNWQKNANKLASDSGYGKNSFSFQNGFLDDFETIEAEVSSVQNSEKSVGRTVITLGKPKIVFYEEKPEGGGINYGKALRDGDELKENTTIVALPYFISPPNPESSDLSYNWSINGNSLPTPQRKNAILPVINEPRVEASISLSIASAGKLFQTSEGRLKINLFK